MYVGRKLTPRDFSMRTTKGFLSTSRRHFSASDIVVSLKVDAFCLFKIVLLSKVVGTKRFVCKFHCSVRL